MRIRAISAQVAFLTVVVATQLRAQSVVNLTVDLLDRWLKGAAAEQEALGSSADQVKELDDKIAKFRECKKNFEIAAGGGGKLGMGARIAMRAKCGASDEDGFVKERNKLTEGPTNTAAKTASMKPNEYTTLKEKLIAYMQGDRFGFSQSGLDLLKSRESDLSKTLGMPVMQAPDIAALAGMSGGSGRRGARMNGAWTSDYAWSYIGELFMLQYGSGASMFEEPYKPGEWTQWKITDSGNPDESQTIERAFLTKADSSEWWRIKTLSTYKDGNKEIVDTVILEALYKPTGEYTRELVRLRAKLPGNKDPQEMLVPAGMGMINYNAMFPMRPTKESVDGATVGTEKVQTKAGSFTAKHVRFGGGSGGGNLDWWLTKEVPGGWVKFTGASHSGGDKDLYTMELIGKGVGAKSELGVIK